MTSAGARGFTLVELTITLLLVGVLLAGIAFPLRTQIGTVKADETRRMLDEAGEALLAYASVYGRFPCPANATDGGREPATGVSHATGACPSYNGYLPAALLGYTPVDAQGYAVDPWGSASNRIRYAVSKDTIAGITLPFTRLRGMALAGVPSVSAASSLLYICGGGSGVIPDTNCGPTQTLASNAVFVVWSVGPNGAGGGTSVHEAENPNPSPAGGSADRIFVSRAASTDADGEFDDVLSWKSTYLVVSRLVAAGQLP